MRAYTRFVLLLVLPWVLGLPASSAQIPTASQDLSLASRAPRFLYESSKAATPVEVDPNSSALLRRVVSLKLAEPTIGNLLTAIERQTGLQFAFKEGVLPLNRPVALRADAITVSAALLSILMDAGVDVLLSRGRQVALVERSSARPPIPLGAIVGRVTDKKTGAALGGATVVLDGTHHSATTGNDGRYRLAAVASGAYTVRARYIGYAPGMASVTVSADQEATADFTLEKSAQRLDEVVTTGTVVETEVKALPSPIAVITGDEIREKHIDRVDQLFRGDVPGVFAWNTGETDDQTNINVRGGSTLGSPFGDIKTYVDGVELTHASLYLPTIDPNSIDRIELIRGPQASTIYGAGALNGVLQIFTKRGSAASRPVVQGRVAGGVIQNRSASEHAVPTYVGEASVSGGGNAFSYSGGAARTYKGEWVSGYRDAENNVFGNLSGGQGWLTAELSGRLNWQDRGGDPYPPPSRALLPVIGLPAAGAQLSGCGPRRHV